MRHLILVYRKRERMSARRFGDMALGDQGCISHRLKRGSSVGLKTADRVLAFMGEPPFGPWFRCEVETFIAITGSKAHWLGHYAVNDPSFVSRLRRDATVVSPPVEDLPARWRGWSGDTAYCQLLGRQTGVGNYGDPATLVLLARDDDFCEFGSYISRTRATPTNSPAIL